MRGFKREQVLYMCQKVVGTGHWGCGMQRHSSFCAWKRSLLVVAVHAIWHHQIARMRFACARFVSTWYTTCMPHDRVSWIHGHSEMVLVSCPFLCHPSAQ